MLHVMLHAMLYVASDVRRQRPAQVGGRLANEQPAFVTRELRVGPILFGSQGLNHTCMGWMVWRARFTAIEERLSTCACTNNGQL